MRILVLAALCCCFSPLPALAGSGDVEPHMHIAAGPRPEAPSFAALTPGSQAPSMPVGASAPLPDVSAAIGPATGQQPKPAITVALTFDACMGAVDERILSTLVDHRIPATIFVTRRWLQHNHPALAVLRAHPELFEIENHGAEHLPPVTDHPTMFGLKTAGTIEAVRAEIQGGNAAVLAATGQPSRWFRGATARYSRDAVAEIGAEGFLLAGYSLNADMGASLGAAAVEHRIRAARDGDVIIAHINQPKRPSGAGVAAGILALQAEGVHFVRLEDATIEALR